MIKQTKEQEQKSFKQENTANLHLNQTNEPTTLTKEKRTTHQVNSGLSKTQVETSKNPEPVLFFSDFSDDCDEIDAVKQKDNSIFKHSCQEIASRPFFYIKPQKKYQTLQYPKPTDNIEYQFDDDEQIQLEQLSDERLENYYNLEKKLEFSVKCQYSMINLTKNAQYLPGMVTVQVNENEKLMNNQRVGVDLICLLDKSGSMEGQKMEMVKSTIDLLLSALNHNDRLQLISFDHDAHRLTPLKRVTDENKQYFRNVIGQLNGNGATSIYKATQIALTQLEKRKYVNNVTSVFLLSDGQDSIDSSGEVIKKQFETSQQTFSLHCFGFGNDHDANLMTKICNLKNGGFYFVSDISLLDEFFVDALGGLISVVGENIEIDIRCLAVKPFQEMKFYKTYGDMWNYQSEKEYKIQFPQLISGTRKDYVFELRLPKIEKIDDYQRTISILEATIKTKNSVTGQLVQKYFKLDLSFYNQNEQIVNNVEDSDVTAQYMRVKGTEVIDDARRACNQGQFKEAEQMIDKMIQLVQSKSQLSSLPASEILFDLSQAKQASNQRSYRTYGQSQMIQMTQNNYQQQGLNSNFDEFGRQIPHAGKSSTQNYYSEALVRKIQKSKQQYQTVQYY